MSWCINLLPISKTMGSRSHIIFFFNFLKNGMAKYQISLIRVYFQILSDHTRGRLINCRSSISNIWLFKLSPTCLFLLFYNNTLDINPLYLHFQVARIRPWYYWDHPIGCFVLKLFSHTVCNHVTKPFDGWKFVLTPFMMQFLVKKGRVLTPHADYCLPGITRATVSFTKFFMYLVYI